MFSAQYAMISEQVSDPFVTSDYASLLWGEGFGQGGELDRDIIACAAGLKAALYAERVFVIVPVYVTSVCQEQCQYRNFRAGNKGVGVERRRLTALQEIAGFYKVDKVIVAWRLSASILAIQLNRIVNGVTRPLWGWISDHIGREKAMFTAFLIEGLAVWAWLQTIQRPVLFVLLSSLVFSAWCEIFSLFASITADLFGRKWATTNYGLVYTSKGAASIFAAPLAAYVMLKTGSRVPVFYALHRPD